MREIFETNCIQLTFRAQMRLTARIKLISLFRERRLGVRMTCYTAIKHGSKYYQVHRSKVKSLTYAKNLTQNITSNYKKLYEVNWFKQNYYGNLVSPVGVDITTYTDLDISLQFYLPNHGSDLLTNASFTVCPRLDLKTT
jgi:hypothetical protein